MAAKPLSIKGTECKSSGCASKAVELTSGDLLLVSNSRLRGERSFLTRWQKSAEGVVAAQAAKARTDPARGIKGAMSTRRDSTTDKRQKSQYRLAFPEESRGAAPMASVGGTESELAKRRAESPTSEQWMEEVCERENCKQALRRVKANKGSPGIDGMTVEQLPGHLKEHWPAIREQLFSGTYTPQPVRRVEIPKPDGGVRKLGIPTVLDRFIQQAVMQALQRSWDGRFSEHSYGFRPKRSAHQAVEKAQQ